MTLRPVVPNASTEPQPVPPHTGTMKLPPSLQLRDYYVVVSDPLADWRCEQLTVRAISRDEARRVAREQLAVVRRDHWTVTMVLEAEKHERLDAEGMLP